ncbi:hypothetical protein L208DRAFT_757194 [Tricholoma matsutake]|nr:hypothetical protein L208DRAFT_757194 [Tricholoma matsutake 945]
MTNYGVHNKIQLLFQVHYTCFWRLQGYLAIDGHSSTQSTSKFSHYLLTLKCA